MSPRSLYASIICSGASKESVLTSRDDPHQTTHTSKEIKELDLLGSIFSFQKLYSSER